MREQFLDWCAEHLAEIPGDGFEAYAKTCTALSRVRSDLLRRANAEPGQPHSSPLLAWASDKLDIPAPPDLLDWCTANATEILAGGLIPWYEEQLAAAEREPAADGRANELEALGIRYHEALAGNHS